MFATAFHTCRDSILRPRLTARDRGKGQHMHTSSVKVADRSSPAAGQLRCDARWHGRAGQHTGGVKVAEAVQDVVLQLVGRREQGAVQHLVCEALHEQAEAEGHELSIVDEAIGVRVDVAHEQVDVLLCQAELARLQAHAELLHSVDAVGFAVGAWPVSRFRVTFRGGLNSLACRDLRSSGTVWTA